MSKYKKFYNCLLCRIRDDDVTAVSTQIAYYSLLSFFPFLIFIISLTKLGSIPMMEVINIIEYFLPEESISLIRNILNRSGGENSYFLSFIGILTTIWIESEGVGNAIKGLNKAYDVEELRPYWKVKGWSLIYTLILIIIILFTFIFLIFGKYVGIYLIVRMNIDTIFYTILRFIIYIALIGIIGLVFTAFYSNTPNKDLSFRQVLPGALFSTLGWVITSTIFSTYFNNFVDYGKIYGSIGGVFILLIWLYLTSLLLMIGGEINAVLLFDKEGIIKPEGKKF